MGRSGPGRSRSPARTARRRTSATPTSAAAPTTSVMVDAALAAGRQGDPLLNLIGAPKAAINGVSLDSAVAYDHDKLTAAVETLATTIDQTPVDATVSGGQGGTFSASPAKDGRAVDKAALVTALDQQLAALDTPESITMAVPVVPLAPAVATASAEEAKAAADRMAADVVVARGKDKLDDRRHEPRSADLVLDRGRRERHPGPRRVGPRPDPQDAGQEGQPDRAGRGPQAGQGTHHRHRRQPRGPHAQRCRHEGRDRQRDRGPPGGRAGIAGRGRRQGHRPEADHGGRQGVRPEDEGRSARTASTTSSSSTTTSAGTSRGRPR